MPEGIVSFEHWSKLDLRVGKIIEIEDVEGADKLYKLTIDLGSEKRTVCAGLKPYYPRKKLEGRKIILFTNLAPRKLRGIESQGMLLAAVNEDETKVSLIEPDSDIEVGSRVR